MTTQSTSLGHAEITGLQAQGVSRPDIIYLKSGWHDRYPTSINSKGYFHQCCDQPPRWMNPQDVCRAFAIVKQFQGFSEAPLRPPYQSECCGGPQIFEYGGVKMPTNHVPQLLEIFKKYHHD